MKRTLLSGLLASAGLITANGAAALPNPPSSPTSNFTSKTAPASTAAKDGHDHPIRVSGEAEQAKLTHKVNPVYPPVAKAARVEGTVRLDVTISKEGVPEDIQVIASPNDDLAQSAVDAVRQWRYETTLLNGQPVEVVAEVVVNYTLRK